MKIYLYIQKILNNQKLLKIVKKYRKNRRAAPNLAVLIGYQFTCIHSALSLGTRVSP